jgi:TrmH family RNA methyltransferase
MKHIASRDNALYKTIRLLGRSRRVRREEQKMLLDGVHLVQAYLERFGAAGVQLVVRHSAAQHPEIRALAQRATAVVMSDALFNDATSVQSPVGILALAPLPHLTASRAGTGFQILLDGIQDPGNLGAILRSAAAAGATIAHLSPNCADPWSPKCMRGGMGAQLVLALEEHDSLVRLADTFHGRLLACAADGPVSLFDADLDGEIGFIIGSEGHGVSPDLAARAEQTIRIPMRAGIDSLNVGAAAAVCFYEWARRSKRLESRS